MKQGFYVNPKQHQYLRSKQKRKTAVMGRGTGKTYLLGIDTFLMQNEMPRAKMLLAGLTYNQLYNVVLPPMEEAWNRLGLREYDEKTKIGDYVIGKKPPSHFLTAYQKPRKPEYCIYFLNGFTMVMGSLDRPDTLRGGNYDGLRIDESALISEDDVNKVLMKMVRGNIYRPFSKSYLHHSVADFTSMPWTPKGQWVFKTEELAKQFPDRYYYIEGKTRDNLNVLGDDYLRLQKETSTELEYMVECENYRLNRVPNGFYPSLSEEKHCVWRTYDYVQTDAGLYVADSFYNDNDILELSFDFNAAFTSMLICQEKHDEFRIINELYVTDYKTIDDLIDKFIAEYPLHKRKEILIYGDRNGNNRIANSKITFYQQIINKLQKAGWRCRKMVTGLDPEHKLKHRFIDNILRETDNLPRIRINQHKCKWLIVSMQNAPITLDFKKDKSSELRLVDRRGATDLSDCFDNIVFRKYATGIHIAKRSSASSTASFV